MAESRFFALFSDVGGVLGTNGWDTGLRLKIANHFACDLDDVQGRHRLMFDSYERGHMNFEEYLQRVFFGSPRSFTIDDVRNFAYNESVPWPTSIELLERVKSLNQLKLGLISNEGEGLTEHRVRKFGLRHLADFLIFSHFVHMRKPDPGIWRLALHLVQASASESIYVDDRELFVQVAREMGFAAIHHVSVKETREQLRALGLRVD
jgi:putative hydrolase of the HAD superfamily